ncbi:MAG: ABC transporter ATP-binding protein [Anaerolineales bacterium]|nr:ABC transporter ATP-binding protein [Anaerolineales bacterium]
MTGYKGIYLGAIVAIMLGTLAQTGIYYLLRYFVDDVLLKQTIGLIVPWIALGFLGLAALQGTFTFLSGRWAAYTAEGIARRVRNYLYDHIQRLTLTYHDQTQTGELIQRATSDVDAFRLFFAEQAIGTGRIMMLFLINWIGILFLNVYLGLMSVLIIPVVILLSVYFFKKVGVAFERFQEQEAVVSNRFQENMTGVRVVKAFARQAYEIERFDRENKEKYRRGIVFGYLHGSFWPLTDIMCAFQMLFGFYLGATMAIDGTISVGTYLAYSGMVIQIIWPIRNLGRLMTQMSTAAVAFGRVSDIVMQDREPLDQGTYIPEKGVQGHVKFDNVTFAYEAVEHSQAMAAANTITDMVLAQQKGLKLGEKVLHNISFEVPAGKTVALLGATGSGKSSLINLLPRYYDYNDGSITIDGVELREYPRAYLRQQIGTVQQEPFLFSRTIRENIAYGLNRDVTDEEVYAAAQAAAVHDVIVTFPEQYNTLVGERGVTLSGGQKQRITLARTLLKNPRILILDDATSSVDTETESQIREALQTLMTNRTTFIIAHRIQSVMTADLILVMHDGQIVQRGTHDELMQEEGIYRRTYDMQARIEDELQAELDAAEETERKFDTMSAD